MQPASLIYKEQIVVVERGTELDGEVVASRIGHLIAVFHRPVWVHRDLSCLFIIRGVELHRVDNAVLAGPNQCI